MSSETFTVKILIMLVKEWREISGGHLFSLSTQKGIVSMKKCKEVVILKTVGRAGHGLYGRREGGLTRDE